MNSAQRLSTHSGTQRSIAEEGTALAEGTGATVKEVPRFVTQARVSHLLAVPEEEIGRISTEAGLGRVERAGNEEVRYFTYDELYQVGVLAARKKRAREH